MAGDHSYVAPKTDGTFGLKCDWSRLTKSSIPLKSTTAHFYTVAQPLTLIELQTRTLAEFWQWRQWRKCHPLAQFSPSGMLMNYRATYMGDKFPRGVTVAHLCVLLGVLGFAYSYGKNGLLSIEGNDSRSQPLVRQAPLVCTICPPPSFPIKSILIFSSHLRVIAFNLFTHCWLVAFNFCDCCCAAELRWRQF